MTKDELRIDDGTGVWRPDGFTGEWEVYWPNRQLKFRANYIDGEEHGDVQCWWENGQLAQAGQSENGVCIGIWSDYFENGMKYKETEYEDSNNFVVRWYGPSGAVVKTDVWVNGVERKGVWCWIVDRLRWH